MKDFFHSKGFKALLAIIFIMFGLMLYTGTTNSSIFSDFLGLFSTPMQKVSTVVTNNATAAANKVTRSADVLQAENEALKKQIEQLNTKLVDYYQIKQENQQYRAFLQLKQDNKDFQFVSAAVIGRDPNDLFYGFTVDKGTLAGIKINDPVITNAGLVGWVSSITATSCKVTTILCPDTKVAALDKVNRESGVVSSDIKLADKGFAKLKFLPATTTIKAGDIIVTSGLGGIYPKNLPIGTAVEVKHEDYDVSLCATIKPFVDIKNVHDIFIITDFEGQGEFLVDNTTTSSGGK